jgi:hypothetical protein
MLYINRPKFDIIYLQGLVNLVKNNFNKNVEFNIINLEYFYFNQ